MTNARPYDTYPQTWPQRAREIKDWARWRCLCCGHHHDPAHGYTLTVAHLNPSKPLVACWNLAALCQRCHLATQHNLPPPSGGLQLGFFPFTPWERLLYYCYPLGYTHFRRTRERNKGGPTQ